MAIIFSPVANEEMTGAFKPLPGCAFVMMHSAKAIAPIERAQEDQSDFCPSYQSIGHLDRGAELFQTPEVGSRPVCETACVGWVRHR